MALVSIFHNCLYFLYDQNKTNTLPSVQLEKTKPDTETAVEINKFNSTPLSILNLNLDPGT